MAELHEVDAWLAALLSQLEPAARNKILREVARDVRRIQQANITAQRSPNGTAWEPRRVNARSKKGRIRRGMFAKMKTAKYLKARVNADIAEIAFVPGGQRLARVHHYGLRDRVSRRGPMVKYPERQLIGLNSQDEIRIKDVILRSLSF